MRRGLRLRRSCTRRRGSSESFQASRSRRPSGSRAASGRTKARRRRSTHSSSPDVKPELEGWTRSGRSVKLAPLVLRVTRPAYVGVALLAALFLAVQVGSSSAAPSRSQDFYIHLDSPADQTSMPWTQGGPVTFTWGTNFYCTGT